MDKKKVAVIMGSDSDWPVVEKAVAQLRELDIPVEARVMSAHRTPEQAREFAVNARAEGFGVIIAAAGKAAHLAGALAAEILSVYDGELAAKLDAMRVKMTEATIAKDEALQAKLNA